MATIAPTQLIRSGNAIYLRDSPNDLAVALSFGSVTSCHLVGAGTMPGSYPAPVRYISIFPLEELLPQTTALWGHILGLNPVTGPVIAGEGILFQTKRLPRSKLCHGLYELILTSPSSRSYNVFASFFICFTCKLIHSYPGFCSITFCTRWTD